MIREETSRKRRDKSRHRDGGYTTFQAPGRLARLEKKGDLFAGVLNERPDLLQALKHGERLLKAG